MLAAHAVELFLKGAVLKRNPSANFKDYGHSMDDLSTDYRSLYPEPSFKWDIPFSSGLTEEEWMTLMRDLFPGLTEAEMARIKGVKEATPDPSILYRYPVQKGGGEWPGLYGFEPHSFLLLLGRIESDFARIKSQMA